MIPCVSSYGASLQIPEKPGNLDSQLIGLHQGLHQIQVIGQPTLIPPTDPTVMALAAFFDTLSAEQRASLSALLSSSASASARTQRHHHDLRIREHHRLSNYMTLGSQPKMPSSESRKNKAIRITRSLAHTRACTDWPALSTRPAPSTARRCSRDLSL